MSTRAATTKVTYRRRRTWQFIVSHITERTLLYILAGALALFAAIPFLWTISTSLKSDAAQLRAVPPQWIPRPASLVNYVNIWRGNPVVFPFQRWLTNSVFLTMANLFGETFFSAAAGYGFARFRFPGRQFLFTLMLSGMLLPWAVRIVPTYMMFASIHWTNTYWPLILPHWFGGAYLTFLFRQYYISIPKELDEAAKLDGAGSFGILWNVILPLSKPILATAGIFVFMGNWTNWLGPLIYLRSVNKLTLAVGMMWFNVSATSGVYKDATLSAYGLIMALPIILLFFVAQNYFVQGIRLSVGKE